MWATLNAINTPKKVWGNLEVPFEVYHPRFAYFHPRREPYMPKTGSFITKYNNYLISNDFVGIMSILSQILQSLIQTACLFLQQKSLKEYALLFLNLI